MNLKSLREKKIILIRILEGKLERVVHEKNTTINKYWETVIDGKPNLNLAQKDADLYSRKHYLIKRIEIEKMRLELIDRLILEGEEL